MRTAPIAIFMVLLAATGVWSDPIMEVTANQHDFGLLPKNSVLVHTFWLKATGEDTVRIDEIKTGCSCAVSKMDREWIAPGDSLDMEIEWDISKFRSALYRSIRVFYNGKPDPTRVSLKGQIVVKPDSLRPISLSPFRFELASTSRKDIDSLEFVATNHTNQDLNLRNISADLESCMLVLPATVPANSTATGYIRLKPEYDSLEFRTSVTIAISDFNQTNLTVPIRRKFYR